MSKRGYSVVFSAVAVTAAQDFFEIIPVANRPIELAELHLSQSTEVGDAQEEMLDFRVIRGHTTSGSGGSAPTPSRMDIFDGAAGFTAEANNTTIASAGTTQTLHSESFNVRTGLVQIWPEVIRPKCSAGESRIVVRLISTPADSITMNGTLYVIES